ncbi:tyrosine-type recombinase/integrase [Methanomethylovorans sp.]|uniref:tyrosine-type recombinase/integrase n=1 Tax=Methanomethylovorans sp. TaxID=2758717 RepID=UPI00351C8A9F
MNDKKKKYANEADRARAQCDSMLSAVLDNCDNSNKDIYRRFINSYKIAGASPFTIRNNIGSLTVLNNLIKKPISELGAVDVEDILIELNGLNMAATSKKAHTVTFKCVLKFAGRKDLVEGITLPNTKSRAKVPDDLLTKEEIKLLIDNAANPRDKALISLVYESGARLGELLAQRIKHIAPHEKGTYIHFPEGKTGARKILVIFSGMYLNQWLINHPERDNREAFLWCQLFPPHNPISATAFRRVLTRAADRAGIQKKVNPHAFRHAQATELAKDFTEQQMKQYLGWAQDSKMAAVYVHLSGRDMDAAVLAKNGIEIEKRDTRLKADECPRCHKMIPPEVMFCGFCGLPLTAETVNTNEQTIDVIIERLRQHPEVLLSVFQGSTKQG